MIRRILLPLAATALALPVATATAAHPVAHIAKNCHLSSAENGGSNPSTLGPMYVYQGKFNVSGVSCSTGKQVAKAYYSKCKGNTSSCSQTIKGFHCSQKTSVGVASYDSTTSCKKGSSHVSFIFTANRH